MRKRFLLYLASLLFVLSINGSALACMCAEPSLTDSYRNSEAIFSGKVIEIKKVIKKVKFSPGSTFTFEVNQYKFRIDESFLGLEKAKTVIVSDDGTRCDFPFRQDETYLVWAHEDKQGELGTNSCTPTGLLKESKDALDFLQKKTAEKSGTVSH